MNKEKEILPPNPKPKAEVKDLLADKIKSANEGKIVKK